MSDIVLNKKASIERCIKQVRTYYSHPGRPPFEEDLLRQDAIVLNIQRACEQAIDLANHVVKVRKLGLPKDSRESFSLLVEADIIDLPLARQLQKMVAFRNRLIHQYQDVDIITLRDVIENRMDDLLLLTDCVLKEFFP